MLSEQLTNLSSNYHRWESLKSAPSAARPTNLNIPLTIDTTPNDIPSPTPSEDIPSPTESESCDSGFSEERDIIEPLTRRRSLPVVLLENKSLSLRRPSLSDGRLQINTESRHSGLLDIFAQQLSQTHNSVCNEKDKVLLAEILENLFLSNSLR